MIFCRSFFLVFALLAVALPAVAYDGVQVAEADGYITRYLIYDNSPTPGYCDWRPDSPPVPAFQATNADGAGNIDCDDPWFIHCDNDSLVYRGSWPTISLNHVDESSYEASIVCTVDLDAETGMYATRGVAGNLTNDYHTLSVQHPDGAVVEVFTDEPGPDDVQMVLGPGTFLITMSVYANQLRPGGGVIDPYEGFVLVEWGDPGTVAVEATSWSSLKALFR